jgi:SIR2-like domain
MDDKARHHLVRELRRDLADKRIIVLTGAGVSMATSNNQQVASWVGLLRHGVNHCAAYGQPRPVTGWAERMQWLIERGDIEDLLAVATQVERRLQGDKFRDWLAETIGKLSHNDSELPDAIVSLNAPIVTTNYDDYAATETGDGAVPWVDRPDIDRWLSRKDARHLHLRGVWHRPDSIVLGFASYGRIIADQRSQFVQKVLGTRRLLLIGCGAGIEDPNLGPLLGWLRDALSGGHRNDYLLCLDQDADNGGSFVRVPFGRNYAELAGFLTSLAPLWETHQEILDLAFAYEAITLTTHEKEDARVSEKNRLVTELGNAIRKAEPQCEWLLDSLEDWSGGIGPGIGLVKAIALLNKASDVGRILTVALQLSTDVEHLNPKHHVMDALITLGASVQEDVRHRACSVLDLWERQEKDEDTTERKRDRSFLQKVESARAALNCLIIA